MHQSSIRRALDLEIAEVKRNARTEQIEPAGIEALGRYDLGFAYRITLAYPPNFNPDQPLTFSVAKNGEKIKATLISQDDEGIVVHCEAPLPDDARLVKFGFDPTFILRALATFLDTHLPTPNPLTEALLTQKIPPLKPKNDDWVAAAKRHPNLNPTQRRAVALLGATPIQLLWGPPGTGKTHTLAHSIAQAVKLGWSVLVVAPTNAALDALVSATGRLLPSRLALYRSGASTGQPTARFGSSGHLRASHPELISRYENALDDLQSIEGQLKQRYDPATASRLIQARNAVRTLEGEVREHVQRLVTDTPCVAVTTASLVLKKALADRMFDLVVVDESSMVNIAYAFSASCLASRFLCYGGDPKQLPPICQSDKPDAVRWLGRNLYHWLDMDRAVPGEVKQIPFLDTQYRMTTAIGELVSAISYGGKLKAARVSEGPGAQVEFIDTSDLFTETLFSVGEKSYYQPASLALLFALLDTGARPPILVLSPFRPQRAILAEACRDRGMCEAQMMASTIHRAQGSESSTVVVDLTAFAADPVPRFYRSHECDKLINVAISRARDRLIVIGSRQMLQGLATTYPFWRAFVGELDRRIKVIPATRLIRAQVSDEHLRSGYLPVDPNCTVFYSHGASPSQLEPYARMMRRLSAQRKVLCARESYEVGGDVIFRRDESGLPRMLVTGGRIFLPAQKNWVEIEAPLASSLLTSVAFGHLLSDGVTAEDTLRLLCPRCASLTAVRMAAEGPKVVCTNDNPKCFYTRRLTRDEADKRGQLLNVRCPSPGCDAPMTAQAGRDGRLFFGCTNYPRCTGTRPLRILDGI